MTSAPLLDTHIWVWWMHGDPRLSPAIIEELDSLPPNGRPVISDISLWEVAMLVNLGRLHLDKTLESWFEISTNRKTVKVWPITSRIAAEVARLPESFHRDPADRLIVATSRVLGTPLITHDARIVSSGLTRLWRTPSKPRASSFRDRLPRLFELMEAVADVENEDSYFREFEKSLALPTGKLSAMTNLESQLSVLDQRSWDDLKLRAAHHAITPKRGEGRGWQEMFDVFSEARAYGYLHATGASGIRFIPRGTRKTPDLEAMTVESPVLCEVKTINISDDQALKNARRSQGAITVAKAQTAVKEGLLTKVGEAIRDALEQLSVYDPTKKSRWIVFVVLNFDDFLNEFIDRYINQIDEYLITHPCADAELIFAPRSNPFGRALTMRSAAVYLD